MVFSDYIHAKYPHEHIFDMLSSRWIGITELFRIESIIWNAYFALIGCSIGFFIALFYGKLLTRKKEVEDGKNELNAILSHIAEGVLVEDRDHNVRFMNDVLKKIYGDKVKKKCYEVFYSNPYPGNKCAVESVINKGRECVFYESVDRDGREFWVTAAPLRYKDDTFVVEIYRDVSEMNRMKKILARSDKMITLGQLSAGIAHELRNPLSAIDSARFYITEALKDKDPAIEEELERIERGIKRSQKIISDLLDFTRDSAEGREDVNINDILESALALVEDELLLRDIEIIKDFGDVPRTYLNAGPMKQAFLNIIVNAVQAIDSVGRLEISTESKMGNGPIRVIIRDTGPGIKENDLHKIFEPFFTTKKEKKGTGLGLAITRSIIEMDGGSVYVESTIDKGTTFYIELPICDSSHCSCYPDERENKANSSHEVL
jgi:signal transduction histidine kinase